MLGMLRDAELIHGDGTFGVTPKIFAQFYTIHGLIGPSQAVRRTVPLVFALMERKTQAAYETLFDEVVLLSDTEPSGVMLDNEQASVQAAARVFANSHISGCLFHLGKCIWRQVQANGLQSAYAQSSSAHSSVGRDFSEKVRMLAALALLPEDEIVDAFVDLKNSFPQQALPIANWFEGRGWARTNNVVEGWHNRLRVLCGVSHLGLFRFLEKIQLEGVAIEADLDDMLSGGVRKRRKKDETKDRRIRNIVAGRNNMSRLDYLRSIANCLKF
ncbi:hypothetical protein BSKO_12571 [Bryopsis sp. KO-2023]|nr:hypothetical protein BSKO_12571 [Bryopsis sp. KO-2023]